MAFGLSGDGIYLPLFVPLSTRVDVRGCPLSKPSKLFSHLAYLFFNRVEQLLIKYDTVMFVRLLEQF